MKKDMHKLYQRDSFEYLTTMSSDSVDLVLTDPPYDYDKKTQSWLQGQFLRISRTGVIVFSPPDNQWVLPADQYNFWIKPTSTKNTSRRYSKFVEMIFFYGCLKWCKGLHWSQYINVHYDKVILGLHPHEKPLSLLERLVRLHTDPGDVVFDPFCGSGSALEAAARLGCTAFGLDLDIDIAVDRLNPIFTFDTGGGSWNMG